MMMSAAMVTAGMTASAVRVLLESLPAAEAFGRVATAEGLLRVVAAAEEMEASRALGLGVMLREAAAR